VPELPELPAPPEVYPDGLGGSEVRAALGALPPGMRAAVVLRDVEGLSTHDAAEIAGVGEAAFKSRLHRGRMQLRALLEPYLGLEEG